MDMQIAIPQIPLLTQQQIAEETFQIYWRIVYALCYIVVVGTHQGITEIPRMFCELVIVNIKAQRTQILYGKYGCSSGIPFTESMYLPQSRYT